MKLYCKRDNIFKVLELEPHDKFTNITSSREIYKADVIFTTLKAYDGTKYVQIFKSRWFYEKIMGVEKFLNEMKLHIDISEFEELVEAFSEKKSRKERIENLKF